jgi:serine/threonine protein kinase
MGDVELVGTQIGTKYDIKRHLGQGGMGQVFEALDRELGRRVALKMIRQELNDETARARFYREARAAAAMTHPNACQLYEVSEHEGQPFLVMELLDGEPLAARLSRGPLPLEEAADLFVPLMDVVSALHRQGLVHRDLKPSNVFLTSRGVKLLDFGLARRTEHAEALTATLLTSPGAMTGTMRYMAPEQITGDPVDARADIFALGVLLFEMLTGRIPFDAETNVEWLNAVLTDDPPSLRDPALASLDPIISRALQRKPNDRYESVEQMSHDVQAVFAGNAPAAQPSTNGGGAVRKAAILPFRVPDDDPDIASLRHGLPEVLTASLASASELKLLSNRVAQSYGDDADLMSIAKELEVDRLLTGSIQRGGAEVRATVQLLDGADGAVLWSTTSTHQLESVMALQDEICAAILDSFPTHE